MATPSTSTSGTTFSAARRAAAYVSASASGARAGLCRLSAGSTLTGIVATPPLLSQVRHFELDSLVLLEP